MRQTLTVLVSVAIVVLFALVIVEEPSYAPGATLGSLPLEAGTFSPSMVGTYYPPCTGVSQPLRWAAFLFHSKEPNTTFHLAGAWTATRPTNVTFGLAANEVSPADLVTWRPMAHCPRMSPGSPPTAAPLPPLARAGKVDLDVTTVPWATLFILQFRTFDRADVIEVTQPFTVTPL